MPKDIIDRAIKKASGRRRRDYEEIRYEGYGPGGVGVIVEVLTDNRNRSASDVRSTFTKYGGNLGETGSVSFMLDRVGQIGYGAERGERRGDVEAAIEAGADDVVRARTATPSTPRRIASATSPRRWKQNSASRARPRWPGGRRTRSRSTTSRARR